MSGRTGAYAGMSNDKAGENPARRKPKVSWGREIRPGLAGPLVEAERRRRWIAGQHSCASYVDRWRDNIRKVSGTIRNVRGSLRGGGIGKSAHIIQARGPSAFMFTKSSAGYPRKASKVRSTVDRTKTDTGR